MNETFCCKMMAENIVSEDRIICYWEKFREYGIPVHDGGSSMICIQYCPWCGKELPPSLRDEWFDRLERLGIKDPSRAPSEMQNGTWWKSRKQD